MNITLTMLWPIGLVLLANIFYNICTKSAPQNANGFLMLSVSYLTAALVSLAAFLCQRGQGIVAEFKNLNWTAPVLGVVIIGLEMGYLLAFRAGWKVSAASVVANISLAVCLLAVGYFLYGEQITLRQCIGIAVCIAGLLLLTH